MTNLDSILKIRHITSLTKVYIVRVIVFPVVMDGCESWTVRKKNRCFLTVLLEKTLENPLDHKEIKPISHKGNQPWIFIGRTDAEEAPILWPPDVKSQLTGKDPDAGKDWGKEENGVTEDKMIGWYHWLNGHEFEQTPGDSEGQEGLACCRPWDHKELDMTVWLNNGFYTHEADLGNVTWFFENIPAVYCKRNYSVAIITKTSHDFQLTIVQNPP